MSTQYTETLDVERPKSSFLNVLAGLSLCLLVATFLPLSEPFWRALLRNLALVGLAAAVGFMSVEQMRVRRAKLARVKKATRRLQDGLAGYLGKDRLGQRVRTAVRQMVQKLAERQSNEAERQNNKSDHRAESRTALSCPVVVTPLTDSSETAEPVDTLTAFLRDISGSGFALVHDRSLDEGRVTLDVHVRDDEPVKFAADVVWSERTENGGYLSGGKLLEVISQQDGAAHAPHRDVERQNAVSTT